MPPARRDPRYSVQDVIGIVQNGESDEDTKFDETDASDEESDNDACVDKENQEPTDCLLYKPHCQTLKMPKKEILNMRKFQAQLASSLR